MLKLKTKILIITSLLFSLSVFAGKNNIQQNFQGIPSEIREIVVERSKIEQIELSDQLTLAEVQDFKDNTISQIKNTLAAFGYFKPRILATIQATPTGWIINYQVNPGRLMRIAKMDVTLNGEGKNDPAFQELLDHLPLHPGDVMNSKLYQEIKSQLQDTALQRGYFLANMEQSNILIELDKYQAIVIIHFNTGPRYYFGDVDFLPSPYADRFLQRFVPFKKYQPFSSNCIISLQENLGNSNFFQKVGVTPRPDLAESLIVPVQVSLVPRKRRQYSFGVGFGTDTGVRGLAGVQFRRLNSMGHYGEAVIQASQRLNHVEASYVIPGRHPTTDLYKFSVAAEEQRLPTSGKSRYEKIEASKIGNVYGWQQTLSLSLRDERSVPTEDRPIINSTMLLPNLNWSKVRSDNLLNPNHGYQISVNLRGASKALISNTDFIQALIQGKALISVSRVTRLVVRGQLGYTFISDVDELPITLQFYAGGAQSVRGYKFQELGPGRTLLVGSAEIQQKIKGNLYGTLFMDAGNVSNGLTNDLKKSVGVGLLWRSPIGSLAISIAQALDNPGHPRMLQFSMGPEL